MVAGIFALVLAVAFLPRAAFGHGAVTKPLPRHSADQPWCPWCLGEHQPTTNPWGAVHRDAEPSSPCIGTARGSRAYTAEEFSHYGHVAEAAAEYYLAGEPFAATIVLDADHNGDARWSFCPHSEAETEECFDRPEHLLGDWTDVHSYWGEASTRDHAFDKHHFPQTVHLPAGMHVGRVTLRWQWNCKWTDEIFVSCIDVNVAGPGSPTPAPPSPSTQTPAPSASTTRNPCVPAPTAAPGSCAGEYQQCGGQGWIGAICCATGLSCTYDNDFYSECRRDAYYGGCAEIFQQCGGREWGGATCCAPGLGCTVVSDDYSQCEPLTALSQIRAHRPALLLRGALRK